ncbi:unnamed protein product [Mycena citricolor]|uniref:Short-chain dehydrogenase n=1 Tax=Mycena citricolor TaxID=2018698 RepID=A0AAD2HZG6_9AGAR|nr:unnamed protein product [Mycena citricolor]
MDDLPIFTWDTTADKVADTFAEQIMGKNVLITGTSLNGIGFDTAKSIAKYANTVIVSGYDSQRLRQTVDALDGDLTSAIIRPLHLDLTSFVSVRRAAAEVAGCVDRLHVLIHNAAAAVTVRPNLTEDGFETQLQVGFLSPFLLTALLKPQLLAARTQSLVVWSRGHFPRSPDIPPVDLPAVRNPDPARYRGLDAYRQVKAAGIIFAREMTRRWGNDIYAFSVHPGAIFTNMMLKEDSLAVLEGIMLRPDGSPRLNISVPWKDLQQGASTTLVAAFDTRLADSSGAYIDDCQIGKIAKYCEDLASALRSTSLKALTCHKGFAKKLWSFAETATGLRPFEFSDGGEGEIGLKAKL